MRFDEACLAELRAIRALLETLLQPIAVVDPADPMNKVSYQYRPFGDRGVDTPQGRISAEDFEQLKKNHGD